MFLAVLFIIATHCKEPKRPPAGEWIKHDIPTQGTSKKRDKLLIHVTRINLKIIMWNERSQTQKSICHIIPHT